ncbi:MAG: hypothetical protein OQL16_06690 [Gammaproteobacteria bacterium]|nr:hypothetical protein [Gammaproteobacteria bacterium]
MTQFKETPAFEDLQRIVSNEVAGIYLARLKEFGVPEEQLRQLAEEICYDIASAMNKMTDFEIPGADQLSGIHEEKTDEIDHSGTDKLAFMEEKTDEIHHPEPATGDMAFLEEKTDEIHPPEPGTDELDFVVDKTDEFELPDLGTDGLTFLEEMSNEPYVSESSMNDATFHQEKTDDFELIDLDNIKPPVNTVKGVMSQDEILRILDAAKAASV